MPVDGEQGSFVDFVGSVTPRLRRTAILLAGDPDLAEDLVQTVLLKMYTRWTRPIVVDAPVAYAQRVLYTTFWAWSGRRWSAEIPTESLPEVKGPDAIEGATTGAVHQALLRLPRRQRAVLVARFYDDLSVEQTAQLMACSESTVKSQTARGLERLRVALVSEPAIVEEP